jgi:tripartite-type tricarboxylate transporter receptor subunit TctC
MYRLRENGLLCLPRLSASFPSLSYTRHGDDPGGAECGYASRSRAGEKPACTTRRVVHEFRVHGSFLAHAECDGDLRCVRSTPNTLRSSDICRQAHMPNLSTALLAGALLAIPMPAALAQSNYPIRPIRIIVPTSPPGGADVVARLIAPPLSDRLGQQVVVDNRAGASTMIGGELAARAAPDGYTLLMGISTLAINPATFSKVPYDALRDFVPITHAVKQTLVLAAHPSFPARTVKELIALAKARPGDVVYSSPGFGTNPQMGMELFLFMTRTRMLHVPYRGGGESIIAIVSGHVSVTIASMLGAIPHVRSGRLRALGVTSARRVPSVPDIPTIAEAGVPGYESLQWYGLLAPTGTPQEIITRLNKEVVSILRTPEIGERLANDGGEVVASTPEEFGAYLRAETDKWAKVAKAAGIKPE